MKKRGFLSFLFATSLLTFALAVVPVSAALTYTLSGDSSVVKTTYSIKYGGWSRTSTVVDNLHVFADLYIDGEKYDTPAVDGNDDDSYVSDYNTIPRFSAYFEVVGEHRAKEWVLFNDDELFYSYDDLSS